MKRTWILLIVFACIVLFSVALMYFLRPHQKFDELPASPQAQPPITGVGIALGVQNSIVRIVNVLPNTPAARAGLTAGLVVRKIDDTLTENGNLKDCVEMIRGVAGTTVTLELIDTASDRTNTVELTRERIM